jgi:transposase
MAEFRTTMGHIQGANRHEELEVPPRLDDYIAADNPVRFIDAFVDELDLEALGFRPVVAAATGRPSSQPGDLLKLDIYGYLYRLRSSRRLAQETQRNVALMWLLKKLRPDHKTSANCRRDHLKPLREVCRTFTLLCKKLELFGGELGAIEGRKFRAVNAKGRNFTKAKLAQLIAQMGARVEGDLTELEAADDHHEAGTPGGARAADLQAKIAALRERRLRYKDLQAEWEGSGQDQLSLTAPDSRSMKGGAGGGTAVCYNVQTAVDAQHKLIVACDVTNDPTDRDWLSPRAVEAQAVRGGPFEAVAEVGYYHGQEVKQCLQVGMTPYIARPLTSANQKLGLFSKDDFTYEAATDTSSCPAGEGLSFRFATIELGRPIRYYATSACRTCPLTAQCTRNKGGRRSTRWVDEELREQMEQRVHARPEIMKQRKALVEHPFGTMKRSWNQGYFLMRGLAKVRAEFRLTVLAYNLRRVLNLVDMPRLLASLG